MSLANHHRDWEDMAALDPMWAILSEPERRNGKWSPDEFFATGESEVASLRRRLSELGFPETLGSALDFGCGLGRITRGLNTCCNEVVGVDISEQMISQAQAFTPTCEFVHNPQSDLGIFPSDRFDVVYSRRVLQHQPSVKLILTYVCEFIRVLKPGGVAAFQIPCHVPYLHRIQARRRMYALLRSIGLPSQLLYRTKLAPICMTSVPVHRVRSAIEKAGGRVCAVDGDDSCAGIESRFYYATK